MPDKSVAVALFSNEMSEANRPQRDRVPPERYEPGVSENQKKEEDRQ